MRKSLLRFGLLSAAALLAALLFFAPIPERTSQAGDLSVTAGSVQPGTGATYIDVIAGATITAGQPCYLDASDSNKAKLAITTNATTARVRGISLHGAASGQPLRLQTGGNINPGATVTVGIIYVVSDNAGAIAASADNGSGDYV